MERTAESIISRSSGLSVREILGSRGAEGRTTFPGLAGRKK